MIIRCLECKSNKVKEFVEENKVFYLCSDCQTKSGKALIIDGKIKVLNTSRGIKHVAVAALIIRDDKLLLTKRRTYPFGWEVPVGHLEYNETLEQALQREVYEEVGLKSIGHTLLAQVEHDSPSCRYGSDLEEWTIYLVECKGEPFINNNEAESLTWAPLDKLPVKDLTSTTYFTLQSVGYILNTDMNQQGKPNNG